MNKEGMDKAEKKFERAEQDAMEQSADLVGKTEELLSKAADKTADLVNQVMGKAEEIPNATNETIEKMKKDAQRWAA